MKLEEILPFIRAGKKVYIREFDTEGEYWIAGYIGFRPIYDDNGKLHESEKILTIHHLNKHGEYINDFNTEWGIPRWAIMCNDWELVNEP